MYFTLYYVYIIILFYYLYFNIFSFLWLLFSLLLFYRAWAVLYLYFLNVFFVLKVMVGKLFDVHHIFKVLGGKKKIEFCPFPLYKRPEFYPSLVFSWSTAPLHESLL